MRLYLIRGTGVESSHGGDGYKTEDSVLSLHSLMPKDNSFGI